ncbi:MAG: hypothetical protein V7L31_27510 [Nostoc sp.]
MFETLKVSFSFYRQNEASECDRTISAIAFKTVARRVAIATQIGAILLFR